MNRFLSRPSFPSPKGGETAADSPVAPSKNALVALRREAMGVSLDPGYIRSSETGRYLSPFLGRGMTFAESRPYQPGDDVRHIDWRVTARTGKPYCKLFHEERERSVFVWVDFRSSMFFATRGRFKSVRAASAAAWIAWVANANKDRIGGLLFSEKNHWEQRPQSSSKAVLRLIHALCEGADPEQVQKQPSMDQSHAALTQALVRLRRVVKPGSQIFLISDFRLLDEKDEAHLKQLSRHNEILLLFCHDPLERSLPVPGLYPVNIGNGYRILNTFDARKRVRYEEQFQERHQHLTHLCRQAGGHFFSFSTEDDPVSLLRTAFLRPWC